MKEKPEVLVNRVCANLRLRVSIRMWSKGLCRGSAAVSHHYFFFKEAHLTVALSTKDGVSLEISHTGPLIIVL